MTMIKCTTCRGTGHDPRYILPVRKCPKCDGSGEIEGEERLQPAPKPEQKYDPFKEWADEHLK